jgi:hypothetical protein
MYKVLPDGTIETSTAQEALELQSLIQERDLKKQRQVFKVATPNLFTVNGHEPESEIVKRLLAHRGSEINSTQMAEVIGAKSVAGVGPKLYHLRRANPAIEQILEERKDDRGIVMWRVKT